MTEQEFREFNLLMQEFGFEEIKEKRRDRDVQEQLDILEERRNKLYLSTM